MNRKNVFISHSSKDILYVQGIIAILNELGISYWKAPEMIQAGSSYAKEIPKAIRECDIFLIMLSKASQQSIWVEKELDSAINNRKIIIPIIVDNEPLNDIYKFYLNNVQMISYGLEKEEIINLLKERLGNIPIVISREDQLISSIKEDDVRKQSIRRNNLFTFNKAPVECRYCKGPLKEVSKGVYSCIKCNTENYDYYQTVKRYLQDNGSMPAMAIERDTGVSKEAIDYFIKEGYFNIIGSGRR